MNETFLANNRDFYQALVGHLLRLDPEQAPETVLDCAQLIAYFCRGHHAGFFVDDRVENVALDIGENLERLLSRNRLPVPKFSPPSLPRAGKRRVLHVTTTVFPIGGHTRTIKNWIENDQSSQHSLVLVQQEYVPVPPWMSDTLRRNGGELIVFPSHAPLLARAGWLRTIARQADLVIMHPQPEDIVPTVAFASEECPPIAHLNHSDHIFWLGSPVADCVINLKDAGRALAARRRFVENNAILPLPLAEPPTGLSRSEARRRLGIPEDQIVLLTVGRAIKFAPSPHQDFCKTAIAILEQNPAAHAYLLGACPSDLSAWYPDGVHHPRLHFLGTIEDPTPYQHAADVYLETFPFGSQTALLEAVMPHVPPVMAYAPASKLLVTEDPALSGLCSNPDSELDYIERANAFIRDPELRARVGRSIGTSVYSHHVGDQWHEAVQEIYDRLEKLRHRPHYLPPCSFALEDVDRAILGLQQIAYGGVGGPERYRQRLTTLLREAAYWARQKGDYQGAAGYLALQRRTLGWHWRDLHAAVKLPVHWLGSRLGWLPQQRRSRDQGRPGSDKASPVAH